jgi:hypothetical protein
MPFIHMLKYAILDQVMHYFFGNGSGPAIVFQLLNWSTLQFPFLCGRRTELVSLDALKHWTIKDQALARPEACFVPEPLG